MSARLSTLAPILAGIAAVALSASSALALDIYGGDDPMGFSPRSAKVASRANTNFDATGSLNDRAVVDGSGKLIGRVHGFAQEGTGNNMRIYVQLDPTATGSDKIVSFVTSNYVRGPLVITDSTFVTGAR
ncbi:hypothetical protein [Frigidibacter sp. MR17.24]|uniref:hypothetical protein n=1 Tax=Frigidibacter sp. MR17.24 TaxID=3127345 RepID=UPI003012DF98